MLSKICFDWVLLFCIRSVILGGPSWYLFRIANTVLVSFSQLSFYFRPRIYSLRIPLRLFSVTRNGRPANLLSQQRSSTRSIRVFLQSTKFVWIYTFLREYITSHVCQMMLKNMTV